MQTLYLIRGIPGSGKTTLARQMLACGIVDAIFAADDWMDRDKHGNYKFNPASLPYAHKMCYENTRSALNAGLNVAVHNTFTTHKEMEPYKALAKNIQLVILHCKGEWKSVHNVPDETIQRMRNRFEP